MPSPSDIAIRASTPDDAERVADLFLAARAAAARAGSIPGIVGTQQSVRAFIARTYADHVVQVALDGDDLVGLLVTRPGWIDHLYLRPDRTGAGLGGRLVTLAQEQADGPLQLWAFQSNIGARRFYERHGFEAVEFTDGSTNMEKAPDVRYVWPGSEHHA